MLLLLLKLQDVYLITFKTFFPLIVCLFRIFFWSLYSLWRFRFWEFFPLLVLALECLHVLVKLLGKQNTCKLINFFFLLLCVNEASVRVCFAIKEKIIIQENNNEGIVGFLFSFTYLTHFFTQIVSSESLYIVVWSAPDVQAPLLFLLVVSREEVLIWQLSATVPSFSIFLYICTHVIGRWNCLIALTKEFKTFFFLLFHHF